MKKRIALLLAAALLLCGCSNEHESYGLPGNIFSRKSTSSSAGDDSASSAPDDREPLTDITVELNRDPQNSRKMQFSDGVITISGSIGDNGLDSIIVNGKEVDYERSGNTFSCGITSPPSGRGYLNISVVNRRYQSDSIRVRYSDGKFSFPDVIDIAESNLAAVSGDIPDDTESVTLQNITISGTRDNAAEVLGQIRELSDKICRGLTDNYSKLRAISRWVSKNIYYDHDAFAAGIPAYCLSLEHILDTRRTVCGGYANMTSALAQAQGILCYNISGEGITGLRTYAEQSRGEYHEWNYALIGNSGIWIDSGWNSRNHYSGGSKTEDDIGTKYFDTGNEFFALDHKVSRASDRNFFSIGI